MNLLNRYSHRVRHIIIKKYELSLKQSELDWHYSIYQGSRNFCLLNSVISRKEYVDYIELISADVSIRSYQQHAYGYGVVLRFSNQASAEKALNVLIYLVLKREPLIRTDQKTERS